MSILNVMCILSKCRESFLFPPHMDRTDRQSICDREREGASGSAVAQLSQISRSVQELFVFFFVVGLLSGVAQSPIIQSQDFFFRFWKTTI